MRDIGWWNDYVLVRIFRWWCDGDICYGTNEHKQKIKETK